MHDGLGPLGLARARGLSHLTRHLIGTSRMRVRSVRAARGVIAAVIVLGALPAGAAAAGWHTEAIVNPVGVPSLAGVSCVSEVSCVTVGGTVAESWNGATWAEQPLAAVPGKQATFDAVSCASTTFCVVVGATNLNAPGSTPLVEAWNGMAWTRLPIASPGRHSGGLTGVSCVSPGFCVAVGNSITITRRSVQVQPIIMLWNGARWRVQAAPRLPKPGGRLDAISCTATNACTAVGLALGNLPTSVALRLGRDGSGPLAERWNGRHWSVDHVPNAQHFGGELVGVSCASRSSCTAVGADAVFESGDLGAFAERWNGAHWTLATAGLPTRPLLISQGGARLTGVSCVSATACVTVGARGRPRRLGELGPVGPLVEVWNGQRWSNQATPGTPQAAELNSISCASLTACTAVGNTGLGGTLLAESNAPAAPMAVAWRRTAVIADGGLVSVKHSSICSHVRPAPISAAVGSKVRFLSSKIQRRGDLVQCVYGYGPLDADEVALVLYTFPKPVGSLGRLEKLLTEGGPDRALLQGVYTGLGVPEVILKLKGPGTSRSPGVAADRGTHVSLATGGAGSTLPIRTLGKLALLALTL
jgi:hypothetical protein